MTARSMADSRTGSTSGPRPILSVLSDPPALWQLVRDSTTAWSDDYAPSMGAALSYYSVFSIAPLLLIVIAVAGLVLGREAVSGQLFVQLQGLLGDDGAAAIQGMVKSASQPGKSALATIVGVVTLMFGATTVFGELQTSLDRIWKAPAAARKEGPLNLIRTRVLSFGMILGIGFLLLISLVVSAGLAALGSWWAPLFGGWEVLLHVVDFILSFVVVTALFAMIYKWLPRARIGWHDVWIGAAATALLFTIGKILIGLYIGKSSIVSGFGAAGSLAVVLVWVYYSAQIFLLGAEFTWVYAYRYGTRRGESPPDPDIASGAVPNKRSAGRLNSDSGTRRMNPRPSQPARHPEVAVVSTTASRDRYAKLELGIAAALGAIAALAAHLRGRLR